MVSKCFVDSLASLIATLSFILVIVCRVLALFFFFQAEDGIRDLTVTGVQTCALPISRRTPNILSEACKASMTAKISRVVHCVARSVKPGTAGMAGNQAWSNVSIEIGRASCRERG